MKFKNWCFSTVVLEKTFESSLDCKEIQPVHPKGNQSWIFIGRTDAEAETPILWPPDAKNQLIGKDPDAGKDWRQKEKGMTENEMTGCHHWLNGHVWVSSGSRWWTGKPGMLQCMGLQRVGHDWVNELNWTCKISFIIVSTFVTIYTFFNYRENIKKKIQLNIDKENADYFVPIKCSVFVQWSSRICIFTGTSGDS